MHRFLLSCVLVLPCLACEGEWQPRSVTGPSSTTNVGAWYPCVGVQSPGGPPFEVQMAAVDKLMAAGNMSWIRLNAYIDGSALQYHEAASARGLRIFNIVHRHDLDSISSWEEAFDIIYNMYPGDIWEIAGEISNHDPGVNPAGVTTPEEFMPKFRRLVLYAQGQYPGIQITTPPTLGAAGGPAELQRLFELGMLDLDVILAINVYTDNALVQYAGVFDRYSSQLANKRVWVTETGKAGPNYHIDHVQRFYPRLKRAFRPDMVCWYIMYGGEQEATSEGLIGGINEPPYWEGPLFKALTVPGGGQ